MSAILFNNPFAAPPPATNAVPAASTGLALTAISGASTSSDANDNTTFNHTGSGAGTAKQAENVALLQKHQSLEAPSNATGKSVINAQTQTDQSMEEAKLGPDLPEVEMPDPLPTSPFLLKLKEAG